MRSLKTLSLVLVLALVALPAAGQNAEPVQVLLLGTYHFDDPGLDAVQTDIADVLEPERQEQIAQLVTNLMQFEPTKIGVELEPERAAWFDSLYVAYREGRHELTRNERQQIGLRMAAALGHERLYPVDHRLEVGFQEVAVYAREHDPEFAAYFEQWVGEAEALQDSLQQNAGVGEIIRYLNQPEVLAYHEEPYARMAEVGADDSYIGADVVARWFQRNARIFANIARETDPGDRMLVIMGSAHAPDLRRLIEASPRMELVDPLAFL